MTPALTALLPDAADADLEDWGPLPEASANAARAACHPGMPQTPPPAWVPELPLYSPEMGVR